ncbi:hypothetical protein GCM10028807_40900 [Spirosoma daeguense]
MYFKLHSTLSATLVCFGLWLHPAKGQSEQNLIKNPDCELPLVNKQIPYWTNVQGNRWGVRSRDPLPQSGKNYFFPWAVPEAELAQTVDVANYADLLAQNGIRFRFSGYVRSWPQRPADQSQIIIDLLDNRETVLISYDLGVYDQYSEWKLLTKLFVPPVQTKQIKIRLLSHRKNGANNDGYFDNLSLVPEITKGNSTPAIATVQSTISGQVFDKQTLKPLNATLVVVGDKSPMQTITTNRDGTYALTSSTKDTYIVSITKDGYQSLRESVSIDKASQIKNFFLSPAITEPRKEQEPILNEHVVLKNVLFKLSTATLLSESFPELDKLADLMQSKSTMKVRLEGHTDRIGDAASNLKLSHDRVAEVKRYLTRKGINATRITIKGYGDMKTICAPPCEANRRVEFIITDQ